MSPTSRANEIAGALKARITDSSFRPRVWSTPDGSMARVYTGNRGEYVQIGADGSVRTSQPRIAWGHVIREVVEVA